MSSIVDGEKIVQAYISATYFGNPARFSKPEFFTNPPLKGSAKKRAKRRAFIEACVRFYIASLAK